MSEGEYPKAAYRLGGATEIWGRMMTMRLLSDAADEADAIREGFVLHPFDAQEPLSAELIDAPKRRGRPPKVRIEDGCA